MDKLLLRVATHIPSDSGVGNRLSYFLFGPMIIIIWRPEMLRGESTL